MSNECWSNSNGGQFIARCSLASTRLGCIQRTCSRKVAVAAFVTCVNTNYIIVPFIWRQWAEKETK